MIGDKTNDELEGGKLNQMFANRDFRIYFRLSASDTARLHCAKLVVAAVDQFNPQQPPGYLVPLPDIER